MAYDLFSPEWAQAFGAEINAHEGYRSSAAAWEWPLVLTVTRDASQGFPDGASVLLDLYHGECRSARVVQSEEAGQAPYEIAADPYTWKQVLNGQLEPIGGIMRGKLRLTRGSMATLARYVLAAKHLVEAAARVETRYPEGLAG